MNQWIVLYCLIFNKEQLGHMISILDKRYFSDALALEVYLYILGLYEKNTPVSLELVKSRFEGKELPLDLEIDASQYEAFIDNLRTGFVNQEIKKLGSAINTKEDINEEQFVIYVDSLLGSISTNKATDLSFAEELSEIVFNEANSDEEKTSDIKYGIQSTDDYTLGIERGEQIVIAGRPSMGKSALMAHIAVSNALSNKVTLFLSLEMQAKKIITRMFADICEISLWKFRRLKSRTSEEQTRFKENLERFKKMPLVIDTTASLSMNDIYSSLQRVKMKYGKIDLLVIDYLQLMEGGGENKNIEISNISKKTKAIAMKYNIPVVLGSQLNRLCEQRDNKRPILSDLRDSGAIEQDADIVICLYRDFYYSGNPEDKNVLELLFRKYRNGEVGKVIVDYNLKNQHLTAINPNSKLGKRAKRFEYE